MSNKIDVRKIENEIRDRVNTLSVEQLTNDVNNLIELNNDLITYYEVGEDKLFLISSMSELNEDLSGLTPKEILDNYSGISTDDSFYFFENGVAKSTGGFEILKNTEILDIKTIVALAAEHAPDELMDKFNIDVNDQKYQLKISNSLKNI